MPTRNRARTLRHTLRTCLDQTFDDFEVVVSDNFSDDDTPDVIAALSAENPRLRGVRTTSYLSMSRNFANGLAHARGENVIFIGDDDGLLPFGLELLARLLDAYPHVDAVRWRPPFFWWPHAKDYAFRFPATDFGQPRLTELAKDVLPRVTHPKILNFFEMTGFTLYHGCWRRSVLDKAVAEGVDLFDGPIPDVLSSIYGLHFARACLFAEAPASIMGVSGKSNGWATSIAKPSEEQKLMRADFAQRSRGDFPDAPPITFSYIVCSPYLGSLLTYWQRMHGSLATFDHEAWRAIFLNQLTFNYDGDADLRRDFDAHVAWLKSHGAVEARGITVQDVADCRAAGLKIAEMPEAVAAHRPPFSEIFARTIPGTGPPMSATPLKRHGGAYVGAAHSDDVEFSIADFADLLMRAFGIRRDMVATTIANDPAAWTRIALTGLERQRFARSRLTRPLVRQYFRTPGQL